MALTHGFSPLQVMAYPTPYVLPLNESFGAPSKTNWAQPLDIGYSQHIWYLGGWINEKSEIRLISHDFDSSKAITTLNLAYTLRVINWDGTHGDFKLKDIELSTKKIPRTNFAVLNETFVISDFVTSWKNVGIFNINFKQNSNESYSNKSRISMVVVYYPEIQ